MRRRTFVLSLGTAPLWLPACAHQEETPLAHLYGKDWVHGAYELSATKYAAVQSSSEKASQNAYSVIAQKGVVHPATTTVTAKVMEQKHDRDGLTLDSKGGKNTLETLTFSKFSVVLSGSPAPGQ